MIIKNFHIHYNNHNVLLLQIFLFLSEVLYWITLDKKENNNIFLRIKVKRDFAKKILSLE